MTHWQPPDSGCIGSRDNFGGMGNSDSSGRSGNRVVNFVPRTDSAPTPGSQTAMTPRSRRLLAELLEDRATPATFNATVDPATNPAGAVAELVGFVNAANANGAGADVINLLPNRTYEFN